MRASARFSLWMHVVRPLAMLTRRLYIFAPHARITLALWTGSTSSQTPVATKFRSNSYTNARCSTTRYSRRSSMQMGLGSTRASMEAHLTTILPQRNQPPRQYRSCQPLSLLLQDRVDNQRRQVSSMLSPTTSLQMSQKLGQKPKVSSSRISSPITAFLRHLTQ
jgi:hypothetical protein